MDVAPVTPAPVDTLRAVLRDGIRWAGADEASWPQAEEALALLDSHVLVPREAVEQARDEFVRIANYPYLDRFPHAMERALKLAADLRACLGGEATE